MTEKLQEFLPNLRVIPSKFGEISITDIIGLGEIEDHGAQVPTVLDSLFTSILQRFENLFLEGGCVT